MISPEEVSTLETVVIALGLVIGIGLGWVARYSGFCILGAISDWYAGSDISRLRMWLLAITTAIVGTQALILSGSIEVQESFYTAPRLFWLSNIVGGLFFGFGMVLASGCGSRTLIRIGGGSLKALVVFIVMAIFAYMTMRGIFAVLRVETIEKISLALPMPQDLPSLLQADRLITALTITAIFLIFILKSPEFRSQPRLIVGGISIGLLVTAAWYTTGNIGFIEEDPNTLEARFVATNTRGVESLTFVAPLAYWIDLFMFWSDTSRTFTFSIMTVTGVVLGAWVHAVMSRSFRLEGFLDRHDLVVHLIGAAMMGAGGVVAFGCTIGQGISGLSLLAAGSLLATLSIVAGAWVGLRWTERRA